MAVRCDTAGPFLREIVNRRIFPWLQIPCSSLRMAGAIDMMAAAQLPKIRDKTRKEKVRRNNLMVWQFPTYPPVLGSGSEFRRLLPKWSKW